MRMLRPFITLFFIGLIGCAPSPQSHNVDAQTDVAFNQAGEITRASLSSQIESVSLLLPVSGPQAAAGKAVRDGFLAAAYEAKARGEFIPSLKVIDTQAENNVVANYREAVESGARYVVGPLTKPGVEQLIAQASFSVPTLVLNETPQSLPADVIQFGLSPENDAHEVAYKALERGHTKALVLAPKSAWGHRMQKAFYEAFQAGGGHIVESASYDSPKTLASTVRHLLKVSDKEEEIIDGKKAKIKPIPRTDADMIFLIGNSAQARQIKPILNFYYAQMDVFAPPSAVSAVNNPMADRDLNGVYVVDSPWQLNHAYEWQTLKNRLSTEADFSDHARLYGMGVDAFLLLRALPSLQNEHAQFNGVSGKLTVKNGRVQRNLQLGQYRNGAIEVLQ